MCLGLPGKVLEIADETVAEMRMGRVEFGGAVREVCLACTPDVKVGDYVLVHAGFSLNRLDEAEAMEIFQYLQEIDRLSEELGPGGAGLPPADTDSEEAPEEG